MQPHSTHMAKSLKMTQIIDVDQLNSCLEYVFVEVTKESNVHIFYQ